MAAKNPAPASKDDVAGVAKTLGAAARRLDAKIDGVGKRLDAKIDGVEKRLDAKIDGVGKRLDAKIDGVEMRLDAKIDGVIVAVVKNQAALERLEQTVATQVATKDDIRRIMAAIDGFAGKLDGYARESVTFPRLLDEHGQTLRDHDRRLKAVESRP